MSRLRGIVKSKELSWAALGFVLVWIVIQIRTPEPWWAYTCVFFAFMMVFCHLAALYIEKISFQASRKLDLISLICGILFILSLIAVYIAETVVFQPL